MLTRLLRVGSKLINDTETRHEVKRRVENFYQGGFDEIFNGLPSFYPTSGGKEGTLAVLTLRAAQNTFPLLLRLIEESGRKPLVTVSADEFCSNSVSRDNAATLGKLFAKYGSDKPSHQYHFIYGAIVPGAKDLLEIGVLFSEERIETFFLDQTDFAAYSGLPTKTYDMIIDDGLHTVDANLTVLIYAMKVLRPGAWLAIEDIHPAAEPIWRVLPALMPPGYESHLIKTDSLVFVTRKPPANVT